MESEGVRKIVFAQKAIEIGDMHGSAHLAAEADIVVGRQGTVLKDRHGDAREVLVHLRAVLASRELTEPTFDPSDLKEADLLGVPLAEVGALTIDGAHWFEVFGDTLHRFSPLGGSVLRFRIAQAPGGKARKLGIGQGDVVCVRESAVCGVVGKGSDPERWGP